MSTGILISVVAEVFAIEGRGCVVVPGLPFSMLTTLTHPRGTPITLRRPDGSEIQTSIRDLEMVSRATVPFVAILFPLPIAKTDIPIGTELWYFPDASDTATLNADSAGT